jgi:LysR family transcriptional regulator, glycine cleavage system transcriptional activator
VPNFQPDCVWESEPRRLANHRLYPPLAALRAFEAVGRLGGIRRAAKELAIDHAVVSRHIRSLESWVGAPLLMREGMTNTLTAQGELYHHQIAAALAAIAAATSQLVEETEHQSLSLWCIPGFAFLWLSDRLGDFMKRHPAISVDFRPSDHGPDFRAREVDCDLRYLRVWEEEALPRIVHRQEVARPPVFPVCSPGYRDALGPIASAADLVGAALLHEESDAEWSHWFAAQGVEVGERLPGTRLWHAHLTLNAARQGQGIALANPMLLGSDLVEGRLVPIVPTGGAFAPVRFGGYTLIAREDRWNAPAVVAFRRWLAKATSEAVGGIG